MTYAVGKSSRESGVLKIEMTIGYTVDLSLSSHASAAVERIESASVHRQIAVDSANGIFWHEMSHIDIINLSRG